MKHSVMLIYVLNQPDVFPNPQNLNLSRARKDAYLVGDGVYQCDLHPPATTPIHTDVLACRCFGRELSTKVRTSQSIVHGGIAKNCCCRLLVKCYAPSLNLTVCVAHLVNPEC